MIKKLFTVCSHKGVVGQMAVPEKAEELVCFCCYGFMFLGKMSCRSETDGT